MMMMMMMRRRRSEIKANLQQQCSFNVSHIAHFSVTRKISRLSYIREVKVVP